ATGWRALYRWDARRRRARAGNPSGKLTRWAAVRNRCGPIRAGSRGCAVGDLWRARDAGARGFSRSIPVGARTQLRAGRLAATRLGCLVAAARYARAGLLVRERRAARYAARPVSRRDGGGVAEQDAGGRTGRPDLSLWRRARLAACCTIHRRGAPQAVDCDNW